MFQQSSSPSQVWGKLIPLDPDSKTIECHSNSFNEFKIDSQWAISHKPSGETFMRNLSITPLKIDDSWLFFSQKKQLFGGEKLAFHRSPFKEKNTTFDYVFCFTNFQPKNELKRTKELPPTSSPQKLLKVIQEEEITCSICLEIFTRCATLSPCGHNFCGSCLILHLRKSLQCPLCKTTIVSVIKHSAFHNIIETAIKNSPTLIPRSSSSLNDDIATLQKDLEGNVSVYKEHVYIGSESFYQKQGQGTLVYPDGRIYQGNWKNDKKEGEGIFILLNGVVITGQWYNDILQPSVKIKYQNGDFYQGETKEFKYHGKGMLKFADGGFYQGDFREGLKEGIGKYVYKNGEEYEGQWIKGGRNGNGIMEYSNGDIYQGEWRKNKREGKGILLKKNGDEYDGSWVEDFFDGVGKYTWKNGQEYNGNWVKGDTRGFGIMRYVNGDIFKGEWGNDELRKNGVLILKTGDQVRGDWIFDKLQSLVHIKYSNGDFYEGEVDTKTFKKEGEGILTLKNGSQYDGHWENDKFNGNGKFIRRESDCVFEAVWENGTVLHSIMTCADGTQYKAEWKKVV